MKIIMVAVTVALVSACASNAQPLVKVSTPSTVIIGNATENNTSESLDLAQAECESYGKEAALLENTLIDYNAKYECR